MKWFYPQTGTIEDWNLAYYRLEDYFRAHHVTNKVHQSQIILRLLERAAAQHALTPEQPPTKLALEEAYTLIDCWFQRLLPEEPPTRASVVGRVSLSMINAVNRWPNVFLADEHEIPAEFKTALRDVVVHGSPDLQVSSMVPRPLDASSGDEELEETWEKFGRVSLAVLIGIVGLLVGSAFFYLAK